MEDESFAVLIAFIVMFFLFAGGAYGCSVMTCDNLGKEANVATKHNVLNGCFVNVDGKWIPEGRWRAVDE